MHHFTPSLQSSPQKWIAFEPLSILIKIPLLRGVRIVKCLIQPVNYNTTHCFSLFNYLYFDWLKLPSSHLGLIRPKLTRETQEAARKQRATYSTGQCRTWETIGKLSTSTRWHFLEGGMERLCSCKDKRQRCTVVFNFY